MTPRNIFKSAFSDDVKNPRPPFWIMRQAGRYLPEYRKLKQGRSFLDIVRTPELAVEATLQPIQRFGFDCAILFSDILVIAEALGVPYEFKEGTGLVIGSRIESERDILRVRENRKALPQKLAYVFSALKILRAELADTALLGFAGSPFTIGAYMVEGASSKTFPRYADFAKTRPELFAALMEEVSEAVAQYAKLQAECGIDGFQIFDSHAAVAPCGKYADYSLKYADKIAESLSGTGIKTILFANSMSERIEELDGFSADAISLDQSSNLAQTYKHFEGKKTVQGNIPPSILSEGSPESVENAVRACNGSMRGRHILNLGHGILPDAKLENVEAFCRAAKEFKYDGQPQKSDK